ncbi:rust resistance kinase Lr10-like protein [Cinnamomum micranthum f. kanehirae]|uniref:Rust resistance kinase Lr10-like protein n=1 Tax=Cinnamomum micranthum f. kanehirae TaxID=337451 RepID=A0A443PKX8_9MAGN|nr:rust resistance kinase Lr10-like protein [Cinnamomum micranthum f. kanehirae]
MLISSEVGDELPGMEEFFSTALKHQDHNLDPQTMSSIPSFPWGTGDTSTPETDAINQVNNSFQWVTAAAIISSIVGAIALVAIVYAIIRCLSKAGDAIKQHVDGYSLVSSNPSASPVILDSQVEMATIERFLNDMAREKPIRFSPQQLVNFTRNYATRLGSGGFGVVYKGEFANGVQVAVKILNSSSDKRVEEQFMAEVSTIGRTYHINLVRLYGFCFDASVRALVYEYMDNGSLDNFLFDKNKKIEFEKLYGIAIGTAKGIAYLHEECQQRIIHYDIKPGNVLLDANLNPKVADFGLAKLINRDSTHVDMTGGGRGTPGYAAPEMYTPFPVTHKCDVYSFGMLLFELVGRRKNHDINQTESREWFPRWVWDKYEKQELEVITKDCEVEDKDREKVERMCKVALWCVQYLPEARPPMSNVVKMLEGAEIIEPQNPFQYLMGSGAGLGFWSSGSSDHSMETAKTAYESSYKDSTPIMRKYEIEFANSV